MDIQNTTKDCLVIKCMNFCFCTFCIFQHKAPGWYLKNWNNLKRAEYFLIKFYYAFLPVAHIVFICLLYVTNRIKAFLFTCTLYLKKKKINTLSAHILCKSCPSSSFSVQETSLPLLVGMIYFLINCGSCCIQSLLLVQLRTDDSTFLWLSYPLIHTH